PFRAVAPRKARQVRLNGEWTDVSDFAVANAMRQMRTLAVRTDRGRISHAADIVRLRADLGTKGSAEAVRALETTVEEHDGRITATAQDVTALRATVGTKADATAVNALTARVSTAEGRITATASDVTSLQSSLSNFQATAFQELVTRVTRTENLDGSTTLAGLARWTVKTRVGDLEAGVGLLNDGTQTSFAVRAQNFYVLASGSTLANATFPFSVVNGRVNIRTAVIGDATIGAAKMETAFVNKLVAIQGRIGTANIQTGDIFDLTIGNRIQSANYSSGPSGLGWYLGKDGTIVVNAAAIRGRLTAAQISVIGNDGITSIDGGKITTGTIDARRLDLDGTTLSSGPNGLRVQRVGDAEITTISGSKITTGTIDARRLDIANGTLIADATGLRVGTISADVVTTGLLDARRIRLNGTDLLAGALGLNIRSGAVSDARSSTSGAATGALLRTNHAALTVTAPANSRVIIIGTICGVFEDGEGDRLWAAWLNYGFPVAPTGRGKGPDTVSVVYSYYTASVANTRTWALTASDIGSSLLDIATQNLVSASIVAIILKR
ncbi:MAG: hypothetical protein OXC14_07615, partial [Rhodospirillaceae bacterium]|nr:hypothetical protein [Rhodospirillaceae bacterium]